MTAPTESSESTLWSRLVFGIGGGIVVCFAAVAIGFGQGSLCTSEPGNLSIDQAPCNVVNSAAWFAVFASLAVAVVAGVDRTSPRHPGRYMAAWLVTVVVTWWWAASW